MHVRVDQARQHVQAGGIDYGVGGCRGRDAQTGNSAVADADIGNLLTPGQDAGSVADQQIVVLGHGVSPGGPAAVDAG